MSKFDLNMLNEKYISNKNGLLYQVKGCEVTKNGLYVRIEKLGSRFTVIKIPEREFFKEFTKRD